VINNCP